MALVKATFNLDEDTADALDHLAQMDGAKTDVIDASVAVLARALNRPVLTSDPADIAKFGVAVERF